MYDRILVPTDGSDRTAAVLKHALEIATGRDATIHGVYVVDQRRYVAASKDEQDDVLAAMETEGERALESLADTVEDAGEDIVTESITGTPDRALLEYVDDNDVDFVVMGSHGKSGRDKIVSMGSVTEAVLKRVGVPVLVIAIDD